ncbi:polyketide synthase [Coccidioides immitis RS]|uniref:Polyketide synthase n=1 Tax=Coccidioides immitis (strain RS) TaxID=246410 RepID=A0A0D8JVS1_COCIM|nr:polyketide synthase [Coccidioides immitis RS]KJF61407.1 polyketide synthase [Coccidioides immitis RS]
MTIDETHGMNGHGVAIGSDINGPITNGHARRTNGLRTNGISTNTAHMNGNSNTMNGANGVSASNIHSNGQIPIAICGMACRLPGGFATLDELWDFLLAKQDGRCRVPESRYNIETYYSDMKKPGTVSTQYGYFLDESVDVGALDMSLFTMARSEVERADPQQQLMLEVAHEAFEDAGVTDWRGKTIGTYIGNFGEDWLEMLGRETQPWGIHRISGSGDFVVANRLSYEFDLRGPSMTIRTACSSALVALNEACAAISRGDCESALVGGVNLILAPGMSVAMQEQGVLSSDGSCKTFSADANGYARGEAVTAIFIKPLADAIRDGNPVQAVVRATSHNVDGKTPTLSQPSTDVQEALMRRAYELGGITDFSETAMVECHGTGTPTGDPIETRAVARVFGEKGVYIGSVKPNLGHTEAASGLISLLKMVKALQHHIIPPNIKFSIPNPSIPFEEGKLTVPTEATPWPKDRLEQVSVNSFGIGGANAHVILESAATYNIPTAVSGFPESPQLLLFTANSSKSITRLVDNSKVWIEQNPDKICDLAYTLARKRTHLPYRAFAIVNNGVIESVSQPINSKSAGPPSIVMVFTGQGAQWPQMGQELLRSDEVFKSSIRSLDQQLQTIAGKKPHYSIEEELKKAGKQSRLSSAEFSQPLCTAIQIALVDTLKAAGIVPHAVVGHSSGEIAAAYAAGALTAKEAITVAHHRGAVAVKQERPGTMAAIGMGWREIENYLVPNVTIACDNSPKSVTISADIDAVKSVVAAIKKEQPQILARLLQVDKAYHSYHMEEIGDHYQSLIEQHDIGNNAVFLEVGPRGALAGPLRQIFAEASSPTPYVSAMTRNKDCTVSFLAAIGALYSLNVHVNLEARFPTGTCLSGVPRYPWNHKGSYWYESRLSKEWRNRKYPYHDLLGSRVVESSDTEPVCGATYSTLQTRRGYATTNKWWEFTVPSYNGRNWTKHCTREASAQYSPPEQAQDPDALPRKLNVRKWFEKMAKGGLNLGGSFQTLDMMASSTSEQQGMGHVVNGRQGDEANYYIILPSLTQPCRSWALLLCTSDMITDVSAKLSSNYSVLGDGCCTCEGRKVVEAVGIRMSLADAASSGEVRDGHAAARCEWKPDIDFLDVNELFCAPVSHTDNSRLLEELGDICLLLSQSCFSESSSNTTLPHLQRHVAWIKSQSKLTPIRLPCTWTGLDNQTISARINSLLKQLEGTLAAPVASAIHQVCMNMDSLLSGKDLEDILPGRTLSNVYKYLGQLERKDPNLRILEIGTGSGVSLHREIVEDLTRTDGEILCAKYMLTTPGYLATETQEKLFPNMDFASLDICQDPIEQGFEEMEYDLVLAIILAELCPSSRWVDYVLGALPTWWSGTEGGPIKPPYLSKEELELVLAAVGFGKPEAVVLDAEAPHQVTTSFVARPIRETPIKKATVLVDEERSAVTHILNQLEKDGYEVIKCRLGDIPPAGQDMISLLDIEQPFFHDIDEARFLSFKTLLLGLQEHGSGMLWATHLIDIGCRDPRYAQVLGLARTIRTERLADLAICQVDAFDNPKSIDRLLQVLAKFQSRQGDEELNPDFEWAIFNNRVQVARFHPFALTDELLVSDRPNEMATLNVRSPGRVNSLYYERHERKDLENDEVEVQVYSAGLNFRDILVAPGIVELPVRLFGIEAAGMVTRVGADVSPDDLQAGTMQIPYFTAIHSIINVGRVTKGQSVLIHSACGVGLAAIQVAQMLEAELYVTVGSDEKVKYLMDHCHIPRKTGSLTPVTTQTQDAFRFMEKGQHIGRLGVSIKDAGGDAELGSETTKRALKIAFKEFASYLMVGVLGGIGRAVSTWMVDHGARELIYMSRSAGLTTKDDAFIHELESMGCTVKLASGDTTKLKDVERAISAATYPLKGVVQMSMVVANENFTKMSYDEWTASTAPKCRNGMGLAASVVDMGAVEDVGWISDHQGMMGKMSRSGFKPVLEQKVIDAMAICMLVHNKPNKAAESALTVTSKNSSYFVHKNTFLVGLALLIPLNDPSNYVIWKKDRRMASYHNKATVAATAASTDILKSYLSSAKADPSILKSSEAAKLFAVEIGKKLLDLLLKPHEGLKTSLPLLDLGLDSLVALELRAWIKQVFYFDLPILEMMSIGSLDILGQYAANEVYRIATENKDS